MNYRDKYPKDNKTLFETLWNKELTLIDKPRFDSIDIISESIYKNNIQGDIVECGTWRGGMSIYLANLFLDRTIWVCDSFEGFQPLEKVRYVYHKRERHIPEFDILPENQNSIRGGRSIKISLDEVKLNFKEFNFEDKNIKFLKGWVKDTLDPKSCLIKDISLLRIDVDAYSATLEVLESLYDKIVSGGYIIFDDSALTECEDAIETFKKNRNLEFTLTYPPDSNNQGGYFKKD
jgi:O-methyltransferase